MAVLPWFLATWVLVKQTLLPRELPIHCAERHEGVALETADAMFLQMGRKGLSKRGQGRFVLMAVIPTVDLGGLAYYLHAVMVLFDG